MGDPTFTSLLIVVAIAFAAPLLLGLFPGVRVPAVVLELVTGIAIGPSGLGWVEVDGTIEVLAFIGLAFLLFLAGLEIDFMQLRGRVLRLAATGYALSFALAVGLSLALSGAGLVDTPLFVAILLSATSLGVIVAVLKDAGESSSTFGQLVIAAGTIADYRGVESERQATVAGLFQATSLPFIVAGTMIGLELGLIDAAASAALVASGLLSVVIFPAVGLGLLRGPAGAAPVAQPA